MSDEYSTREAINALLIGDVDRILTRVEKAGMATSSLLNRISDASTKQDKIEEVRDMLIEDRNRIKADLNLYRRISIASTVFSTLAIVFVLFALVSR